MLKIFAVPSHIIIRPPKADEEKYDEVNLEVNSTRRQKRAEVNPEVNLELNSTRRQKCGS